MGRELPETEERFYEPVDILEPTAKALNARSSDCGRGFGRFTREQIEALLLIDGDFGSGGDGAG